MRSRNSVAIAVKVTAVAILALGGCTSTITGSASPVPGQGPVVTKAEPCSLITQEHAEALGVVYPGQATKADKKRRTGDSCYFSPNPDAKEASSLTVVWGADFSMAEYFNGAQTLETYGLAGANWTRYASIMGKSSCDLGTELTPTSFLALNSESRGSDDDSRACDLAKAAIPAVMSHFPGGPQNPEITAPAGQKRPEPSGPLLTTDPCAMLKPDQAGGLALAPSGEALKSSVDPVNTGCQWKDTDGERTQKPLDLWFYPNTPVADVIGLEGEPQDFDAGGRKWKLYNESGAVTCAAVIAITETSSVKLDSGFLDAPEKACDMIKAAAPLVSGNLPAG